MDIRIFKRRMLAPAVDKKLKAEIQATQRQLQLARNHFEEVLDPLLVDCYIYEINAAQLRYQFLLRRAKIQETTMEDETHE
ncbi:MAG: YaaL family protein [bacterium]|nr:YaaL family protein [bacterium]